MRLLLPFLLLSSCVFADPVSSDPYNPFGDPLFDSQQYHVYSKDEMFNITVGAAQKRPDVSLLFKNGETWFWKNAKHVGITPEIVTPIAVVAAPLIAHKVSTRAIPMDWKLTKNLTLRPDVDYYFQTGETRLAFTVTWRF